LIVKADIQRASKVRSTKGLLVHVFGKIAAAFIYLVFLLLIRINMKKKTFIAISIFFLMVLLILIYKNFENLRKAYIVLFKKSAQLANYNNNGQLDGEFIIYVNGKIEIKANFNNGLKDGWSIKYYSNGQIERQVFFRHNKAEGTEYSYYKNGKLNCKRFWKDGRQYGSFYWYLENGELDSYSTYDINGKSFCVYRYEQSGKLAKMEGFVIGFNIYSIDEKCDSTIVLNDDAYHPNNQFRNIKDLYITVATPPGLTPLVDVDINNKTLKKLTVKNNTIKIPNAFPVNDTYHIFIASHLVDKQDSVVNGINIKTTIIKE
jgi:hypothetical protein